MGLVDGWAKLRSVRAGAQENHPGDYRARLAERDIAAWQAEPGALAVARGRRPPTERRRHRDRRGGWSFRRLAQEFRICGVDVLETDCEGADCQVLQGLMQYCDEHKEAPPRTIAFETNDLSEKSEVRSTIRQLKQRGHEVRAEGFDAIVKRRSAGLVVCCKWWQRGRFSAGATCFFDHPSPEQLASMGTLCCANRYCEIRHRRGASDSDSRLRTPGRRASPGNAGRAELADVGRANHARTLFPPSLSHWATEGARVPNRALVSRARAVSGRSDTLSVCV
eukprot:15438841-Alexandrium_andersonii.AAC.1